MGQFFDIARRYKRDIRGQFAVQFAILALPLLAATTFAIDYTSAGGEEVKIKGALDAAVLAAVNDNSLTPSQKEGYAEKHFYENYAGKLKLELAPVATADRVEMSAAGMAPVTLSEMLGMKGIAIYEKSAAEIASEHVICVMSLATSGGNNITFEESNAFLAPTCSVHSNSSATNAIVSTSSVTPSARSFCAVGGVQGDFQPYGKGNCKSIEDPYQHVRPAAVGACMAGTGYSGNLKNYTVGDNVTLYPGTYCGGLNVTGTGVRFMEGDYVISEGALTFKSGSEARGENVTFTMSGSLLDIKAGSSVYMKAPRFGDRQGLVFMEDVQYVPGKKGNKKSAHIIKGGASLNILGTLYFPTQSIEVKGESSQLGAKAPATSFIAHDVHFSGIGSSVSVKVNHVAAGLPPVMPRVEDGARLVQ